MKKKEEEKRNLAQSWRSARYHGRAREGKRKRKKEEEDGQRRNWEKSLERGGEEKEPQDEELCPFENE